MKSESFWINDISVLYKNYNFMKVVPSSDLTKYENLNTITRFCVWAVIILLLIDRSSNWIYVFSIIILITIAIYVYGKQYENYSTVVQSDIQPDVQIGNFDKNGNIVYDDNSSDSSNSSDNANANNNTDDNKSSDSSIKLNGICRKPTRDNPFMNNNVQDIGKYSPVACNSDDEDVKSQIRESFNDNLFKNMTDLFENKNSERQFYTVPVPNGVPDTIKFANWAYKSKRSCKTNDKDCLLYEDLKYR